MAKIKIKRSTTDQSTPSGLTFGELAYLPGGTGNTADRLFIGDNDAASVWIGAEIENSPGNWTNSTRLATQAATNSRISSLITSSAVASFNGLTGSVTGVTTSVANTFTALQTFNTGISAAGGTFAGDLQVGTVGGDPPGQLNIRNHSTRYLSLIDTGSGTSEIVSQGNNELKIYQAVYNPIYIGDVDVNNNGTCIMVDDGNQQIAFNFTSGYYAFPTDAGSAGQVLTTDGSNTLSWATLSAGTKTYAVFTPLDNQPPATNFATIDTRNSIMVLDFADSSADESAVFVGVIPEGASLGSGLKVRIRWMATTATSGAVRWGAQFMNLNTDCDSDSFDTATEGNTTTSGTSGTPNTTELTVTNIDGLAAGDFFRLKIYREQSDTTNDTMSGDAELIAVEVRSAS